MPTLIVTVDMECCRCSAKIQKVLSSIQDRGKFSIEKIVYGEEKVLVSGPFDADELSCKLRCKAGKVIRNIEVAKPPASKPKTKPDVKPDPPKPKIEEKPTEPEPKPAQWNLVPYAYPCPYPSTWPCAPYCECHSKPAPTCQCPTSPSCHCSSYPPYQMPMPTPCTPMVFCEETPPYGACAVM